MSSASSNSASADIGTTSLGGPAGISAAQLAQMTPDEAYWAEQPPAVQALQNMPTDQREAAAEGLAAQGYSIDVPIMVWGWDPLTTMVERQNYGYTWVPSGDQPNLPLPPGVSVPGLANYNAADAPPGSI